MKSYIKLKNFFTESAVVTYHYHMDLLQLQQKILCIVLKQVASCDFNATINVDEIACT